jgi:sodium/bile acid cotransporter 7
LARPPVEAAGLHNPCLPGFVPPAMARKEVPMNRMVARALSIDPYIVQLIGMVVLATLLPPRGLWAAVSDAAANAGIVLLFFLHGARLSREAVLAGAANWRLHLAVATMTFVLFPLAGLVIAAVPFLDPTLRTGMLFLTLLPSTVQSSIAFTAIARGNVAAAVCSASFSNLAGVVLSPLLVQLLITGRAGGFSAAAIGTVALQLLLPFLVGHLLRPWIGAWVQHRKALLTVVDRGSILLVVYTAFGAAVAGGLWQRVAAVDLAAIALLSTILLSAMLLLSRLIAHWMRLSRGDAIVLQFCGSKKSLASGVPMAGVLFPTAQVGAIILPLMIFHQIQLMVCAWLARRYERQAETGQPADA